MEKTEIQYEKIINECRSLFIKKMKDYGSAWRILRLSSLTDQIFIKAQRIRSIQELKHKKINEDEQVEFIGIINYSIMTLIQLKLGVSESPDIDLKKALKEYDIEKNKTFDLMIAKNHDYGEAWKDMRVSSLTDLIIQKLLRVKQIENNKGKTIISEGISANYMDIINYSIFALIHLNNKS
ncbi:MAG: DUF1599 domain-containing protein [Flavobacteriaceae bacterium]|jgi:hypothetical protein|tara:strand:+ start:99 stop:641 length:543 start_codon:yes stop_codon:yes gene_type:complete